jgi:hypothetical protein
VAAQRIVASGIMPRLREACLPTQLPEVRRLTASSSFIFLTFTRYLILSPPRKDSTSIYTSYIVSRHFIQSQPCVEVNLSIMSKYETELHDFQNIFSLKGKVVVVTGGSRGLGLHAASGYIFFQRFQNSNCPFVRKLANNSSDSSK